jgi:hypothetical protein
MRKRKGQWERRRASVCERKRESRGETNRKSMRDEERERVRERERKRDIKTERETDRANSKTHEHTPQTQAFGLGGARCRVGFLRLGVVSLHKGQMKHQDG